MRSNAGFRFWRRPTLTGLFEEIWHTSRQLANYCLNYICWALWHRTENMCTCIGVQSHIYIVKKKNQQIFIVIFRDDTIWASAFRRCNVNWITKVFYKFPLIISKGCKDEFWLCDEISFMSIRVYYKYLISIVLLRSVHKANRSLT